MARSDLTQEQLKEILHYDPITGLFTWIISGYPGHRAGKHGGFRIPGGYVGIKIKGCIYRAHRLAWLYITGSWPIEIDHINRQRDDNRFNNLRECTRALNNQNRGLSGHARSGLIGAWLTGGKYWTSNIMINRKLHYLGCFKTKEEAHAAYIEAKRRLHPFGEL